jgi:hypothetical protein
MPRFPTEKGGFGLSTDMVFYPPVDLHSHGKIHPFLIGEDGPFSMDMLNNQRVSIILSGLYMLIILDCLYCMMNL